MNIVRIVLALASIDRRPLYQMDVHNTFPHRDLDEEVYMHVLDGFNSSEKFGLMCRLRQSLYELKQAGRQWNMKMCDVLSKACYN